MSSKISVIVPVYKAAPYLDQLVACFDRQTMSDFDVVFINDFSPDNSRDIILGHAAARPNFRLVEHESNRGQGAARNTGLDNASGDYVAYVDADDCFTNDYLEKLFEAGEKHSADVVMCNSIWRYREKLERKNSFAAEPGRGLAVLTGDEVLENFFQMFSETYLIPVEPWGKLVRRRLIEENGLRHYEFLIEDVVMSFAEFMLSKKVVLIEDYLYIYNLTNQASATADRRGQYVRAISRCTAGLFEVAERYGRRTELSSFLTRFYFRYVAGSYSFFCKGGVFAGDLVQTIAEYRNIIGDSLDLAGSEDYVCDCLFYFYREMASLGFHDVFLYFVEPHAKILVPLLRERKIPIPGLDRFGA